MAEAWQTPDDVKALAEQAGKDGDTWWRNCHAASLAIVKAGIYPNARVARGLARNVPGQHSWVVLGDVYDHDAEIIDATMWSYDPTVRSVLRTTVGARTHFAHGCGIFLNGSRPYNHGGTVVKLEPSTKLGAEAREFLAMLGPLDHAGWMDVANMPVEGWPAVEIIAAMDDTEGLSALIPIDVLGHLTDRNPGGLYLPGGETR